MNKFKGYALAMGVCMLSAHSASAQFTYTNEEYNPVSKQNFNYSVCNSDKYFFTCGTTDDAELNGTLDISVTCRDYQGNFMWNRVFDNMKLHDIAGKIAPTPEGVVIVGTTSKEIDKGSKELLVIHLDLNGNIIAQASYTFPDEKVNIYGFDVFWEPKDKTFIIAGMLNNAYEKYYEETDRNGWIMKLRLEPDGHAIQWLNRYSTQPDKFGGWFDAFNNIERIEETPYGLAYHVTGSISDYKTQYEQDQAVMNLLVDFDGNLIWDFPYRSTTQDYPWKNRQYDRGTDALFHKESQRIYHMYHSNEHRSTMFAEIDINFGNPVSNMWTIPFATQDHVEMNMQWGNPDDQKDIVIGGVLKDRNYLISMDRGSYTPNWQKLYDPTFDMNDLINVNYDYNTNPMENNFGLMQRFFVPHMLVNNPFIDGYYRFNCGITNKSGDLFKNLVFQTDHNGSLTKEDNCAEKTDEWKYREIKPYKVHPGKYYETRFKEVEVGVRPRELDRKIRNTCEYITWSQYKPTSVENSVSLAKGVTVYPNPAKNTLVVDIPAGTAVKSLNIVDILGRKQQISHSAIDQAKITVDLAQMAKGIYLIQVATENEVKAIRFVKE